MDRINRRLTIPWIVIAIAISFTTTQAGEEIQLTGTPARAEEGIAPVSGGEIVTAIEGTAHIRLGDSVVGDVGPSGATPVTVRFNAAQDTRFSLRVKMKVLQPTVELYDPDGSLLDLGSRLRGSRSQVRVKDFPMPASGNYALVIRGVSGGTAEAGALTDVWRVSDAEAPDHPTPGGFVATTKAKLPGDVAFGVLEGLVFNALTGEGLPGIEVTVGPYVLLTGPDGTFGDLLPAGDYDIALSAPYFPPYADFFALAADDATEVNVELMPVAPVVVNVDVQGNAVPGGELTALAEVVILDGSTLEHQAWTQSFGAPAAILGGAMDIALLQLADLDGFRDRLVHVLSEPPVGPDQLPPNVPMPEGEFPGGLQDRFEVIGPSPFALEEAALLGFEFEVQTTSGVYGAEVEVHTVLPWKPSPGLRNVPVGIPVLLQGKEQPVYDWTLVVPAGSTAELLNATGRNPEFTPDVPGLYELFVTDDTDKSPIQLEVFAGTWRGVIVGQDADGRPIADGGCTGCHGGVIAPDSFTPWAASGHAEIFSTSLDTSTHYGPNCFSCHTVGYDPAVINDGLDDTADFPAFMAADLLNNPGDNWTMALAEYPEMAKKANIQCENCHGPQNAGFGQDSTAHAIFAPDGKPRTNLSSNVCGSCHGEPLRHGRFQQWQLSAHANYELAIDESGSGSCARCHTVNGFLKWLPVLTDDDPATDPLANVSVDWTANDAHPQTCVTCHGPHNVGTSSGAGTDAILRISGATPPLIAGFTVADAGSGALCMTCHNSRRGLRNDTNFIDVYGTSEAARAPHGSTQTDLLMAQNAYFVEVGSRINHGNIENTCVNCHMEKTPPPDALSYNQGGTNHTFYADAGTCARCHGEGFPGEAFLGSIGDRLVELRGAIEATLTALCEEQIALGRTIDLGGAGTIADMGDVAGIVFGESHGRQAITVTFVDDTVVGPLRLTDVDVLDAAATPLGQLYDFADPALVKSGWNYTLLNNDGSRGAHNPTFATEILDASMEALTDLSPKAWRSPRKGR